MTSRGIEGDQDSIPTMNNPYRYATGRRIVLAVGITTVGMCVAVMLADLLVRGPVRPHEHLTRIGLHLALAVGVYRASTLARWAAVALYGFTAVRGFQGIFEKPNLVVSLIVAPLIAAYLASAFALALLPSVRFYLTQRRRGFEAPSRRVPRPFDEQSPAAPHATMPPLPATAPPAERG